ncbi:predicted protein [Postia placenta Mad-698-R]|nr:predicted protein [Postia placenta Mad-698-R]
MSESTAPQTIMNTCFGLDPSLFNLSIDPAVVSPLPSVPPTVDEPMSVSADFRVTAQSAVSQSVDEWTFEPSGDEFSSDVSHMDIAQLHALALALLPLMEDNGTISAPATLSASPALPSRDLAPAMLPSACDTLAVTQLTDASQASCLLPTLVSATAIISPGASTDVHIQCEILERSYDGAKDVEIQCDGDSEHYNAETNSDNHDNDDIESDNVGDELVLSHTKRTSAKRKALADLRFVENTIKRTKIHSKRTATIVDKV